MILVGVLAALLATELVLLVDLLGCRDGVFEVDGDFVLARVIVLVGARLLVSSVTLVIVNAILNVNILVELNLNLVVVNDAVVRLLMLIVASLHLRLLGRVALGHALHLVLILRGVRLTVVIVLAVLF